MREGARRKLSHYDLWHWFPFGGFGDEHMERCDIAVAAIRAAESHLNGRASAANSNGSPASRQIVVIGDTCHDVNCGRSINAHCVAVPTGMASADELRRSEPDVFVETLEDVAPILRLLD